MAGTSIDLVNSYYTTAQTYYNQLTEWKKKAADALAAVKDLERQVAFHQANDDEYNAVVASKRLTEAYNANLEAQVNVPKYQKLYDDAEKLYQEKKAALLSPVESDQLKAKQDADIAATVQQTESEKAKTEAARIKSELEAQATTFASKNKQMILYVGIALTVIIVAVFVYFKFKRKVKP